MYTIGVSYLNYENIHVDTLMKAILVCILSCLSVFAADINDIRVATRTYKIMPENLLATEEVFTRSGQTNLVRQTHTKDGVVLFRSQSIYHDGTEVGVYTLRSDTYTNTGVMSTPGTPYSFYVGFDASNMPHSVHITTTNLVTLDWFLCTNGVFYPVDSSLIRKANDMRPKDFPPR